MNLYVMILAACIAFVSFLAGTDLNSHPTLCFTGVVFSTIFTFLAGYLGSPNKL